jgi:7-keto-8-aminopelargonate synthetase-like enzyme
VLIVTESVFSMDGDIAPLKDIVELKERHGAWLMLDEAHAIGVLGRRGRGLADALGIAERVEVQMGTLGKALGSAGGYISGPGALRDVLVNRARAFIYSTAPPPTTAAAAKAAVDILDSEEGQQRMHSLSERVKDTRAGMASLGWQAPEATSAILPLIVGEESVAMNMSFALREAGILLPAIRYPTVARGAARLRLTLTAAHTPEDVLTLLRALRELKT